MNETLLKDLLSLLKTNYNYPPGSPLDAFLADPSRPRNISQLDVAPMTGLYCLKQIESILDEYTGHVFKNLSGLDLNSDDEILSAINKALDVLSIEARGALAKQFSGRWTDRKEMAMQALDEHLPKIKDKLQLKIKTRHLDLGEPRMPHISIKDSKNVSVVVSSLNTSISQIIQRGGSDEEAGRIIQEFVEMVDNLKDRAKEQQDLLQLTRGLLKELQLPKEERNESTIRAILERVKTVGSTVTGAVDIIQFVNEKLPYLLSLLGLGS